MPKLIDTHTHVNFSAFKEDGKEVIERALKAGVWLINVGSQYSTSERAIRMAQNYEEGVYAAVGLHPIHLLEGHYDSSELDELVKFKTKAEEFDFEKYSELAKNPKAVAVGETGLDYFHLKDLSEGEKARAKEKQKEIFAKHLELAAKAKKPAIIHCRDSSFGQKDAYQDMLAILKEAKKKEPKLKGVNHFFAGTLNEAEILFELDFSISFTGVITFVKDWNEVIKIAPLEKIMVETDAPYVAPVPYRGKRNEPLYVEEAAKKIAELKGVSFEEVARQTTLNARTLFGI